MHFGFFLVSPDLDLLDTDLDLLEDISNICLQDVLKISWKTKICYAEVVLKMSSRHVLCL